MKGKLSDRPLAELVLEVSFKELSGTLRLQQESVKVAVYFDQGEVIYAASNLRDLRLAEYLKKQGTVSEQELSALGTRSDATLAAALVRKGAIDEPALERVVTRQVGDILRVALLWAKGTWEFDDQSLLGDSVRVKLDTPGLLLEAARRMQLELIVSRFSSDEELISPAAGIPDFNALLPAEGFVISRVDIPIKLRQLIALSGMDDLEAKRTLYGLVLGGFVERAQKPDVLKARRRAAVKPSPVLPAVPVPEPLPSPVEASEETQKADLDAFLARLDGAGTHYEVLNVISSASPDRIKNSYYALARLYHPDKFHLQTSLALHARIESAFARITQAYETLMDPKRRSGYDAKLTALEKSRKYAQSAPKKVVKDADGTSASDERTTAGSESERAENNFKEGYAALQQNHGKLAVTKLAAAARAVPQEARYRAYYGSALAADEDTRRLAEVEMLAAIKLDPDNASYRVMLAELSFDLGFFKRAESEIERALSLEPNNQAARKLMEKLEANRATR